MCLSLRISGVFALGETHSVWAAQIQNPQEQNAAGPGSLSYMSDLMGQHLAPKHLSPDPPCPSVPHSQMENIRKKLTFLLLCTIHIMMGESVLNMHILFIIP